MPTMKRSTKQAGSEQWRGMPAWRGGNNPLGIQAVVTEGKNKGTYDPLAFNRAFPTGDGSEGQALVDQVKQTTEEQRKLMRRRKLTGPGPGVATTGVASFYGG